MPIRESEAIVLRSFPLGEADRIVSFLGRSSGRLRGVARGARRPKSRFGSTLEPLSHVRIWFYERETRDLVRINQCELINSFLEAQREYSVGVAMAVISEVTEAVLPEREPSDAAFRLVLLTARAIERCGAIQLPLTYFLLWTLRLGGWLPSMEKCVGCQSLFGSGPAFGSPYYSGLSCRSCRHATMREISHSGLLLARRMLKEKLDKLTDDVWPSQSIAQLNGYLFDLVEHQTERKLTTRPLLESNS